jgi:hypothetical protein
MRTFGNETNKLGHSLAAALGAAGIIAACGGSPAPEPVVGVAPEPTPPVATEATPPEPPPEAKPEKMSAADCDALLHEAQAAMDAEHIKVDKPCKKDADCMGVPGHACDFTCVDGAIPKAEQADWDEELAKVKEGPCKKWADNACAETSAPPAPTCKDDKKVACVKAHCVLK